MKIELETFTHDTLVMLRKTKMPPSVMARLSGVEYRTVHRIRSGETGKPASEDLQSIRLVLEQEKLNKSKG